MGRPTARERCLETTDGIQMRRDGRGAILGRWLDRPFTATVLSGTDGGDAHGVRSPRD